MGLQVVDGFDLLGGLAVSWWGSGALGTMNEALPGTSDPTHHSSRARPPPSVLFRGHTYG